MTTDTKQVPMLYPEQNTNPIAQLSEKSQAEIYQNRDRMVMARQTRRNEADCIERIRQACRIPEIAEAAEWTVPNRGNGPTIHLMEEISRLWGHMDTGYEILESTDTWSKVRVYAHDIENDNKRTVDITVKHLRYTKNGITPLTNPDDIYGLISNRVSRVLRECIRRLVPRYVVEMARATAREALTQGGGFDMTRLINAFGGIGVTAAQLEAFLNGPVSGATADEIARLREIYNAIKEGATTAKDEFPEVKAPEPEPEKKRKTVKKKPEPEPEPEPEAVEAEEVEEVEQEEDNVEIEF